MTIRSSKWAFVCVCITRLLRRYILYRERCSRGIKKEGRKPIERKRAQLKGTSSGQYAVFKGKRKKVAARK
jgi:hypothetical protein